MKDSENKELQDDMCMLAKLIWDMSVKHKSTYVSGYICKGDTFAHDGFCGITFGDKLEGVEYWGNENRFSSNVSTPIVYPYKNENELLKERIKELERRIYLLQQ